MQFVGAQHLRVRPLCSPRCTSTRTAAMVTRGRRCMPLSSHRCVRRSTLCQAFSDGGGGSSGNGTGAGADGGSGGSGDGSHPMQLWTYLFAALLAAGGAMGYIKKGSTQSLTAGVSASLILGLCARSMAGASALNGARVAFGLTLILGFVMLSRFVRSKKVMPAGAVSGISLMMAAGFLATGL